MARGWGVGEVDNDPIMRGIWNYKSEKTKPKAYGET